MISLHGTVRARDCIGERVDATAMAAKARATVARTMDVRVICRFYTFGRLRVPAPGFEPSSAQDSEAMAKNLRHVNKGRVYDAIQASHDYAGDAAAIRALVQQRRPEARTLLDVACGTGRHLEHLSAHFEVVGVDLEPDYIDAARQRLGEVRLQQGDMTDFALGRRFDVLICMGSSIGYVETKARLRQALRTFVAHMVAGALLIIEPFLAAESWPTERVGGIQLFDDSQLARASVRGREGELATIDFGYLEVGQDAIEYEQEHHRLGLFSHEDHLRAFQEAGLENVEHDAHGLNRLPPRGLYVASTPI
jgi:SAM-dependent methyltransferase